MVGMAAFVALALAGLAALPAAQATGQSWEWKATVSYQCNSKDVSVGCAGPVQGEAASWIFTDTSGSGEVTFIWHTSGPGAGLSAPYGGVLGHAKVKNITWTIDSTTGDFVVTSETTTYVGNSGTLGNGPPVTVTIANEYDDTGIPAAAGHYSFNVSPALEIQIVVTQHP